MDGYLLSFTLQGLLVLVCLAIGVRMGGLAIGLWGGIGVLALAVLFGIKPGVLPVAALGIIFSVVTAVGAMQLAGGIDFLIGIAQRVIHSHPTYVTYLAPIVAWVLTLGAGTGNAYYSLLPIIEEVSFKNGIRPERPLALSPVASQLGITSSPVSAAMAIMVGFMAPYDIGIIKILLIVMPAIFLTILTVAFIQNRRGKELEQDPEYQYRVKNKLIEKPETALIDVSKLKPNAHRSAIIFLSGVLAIVMFGVFDGIRPSVLTAEGSNPMEMTDLIIMVMFVVAVTILLVAKVKPNTIPQSRVFTAGMISLVALFGVAWMANTFIGGNKEFIIKLLGDILQEHPYFLALGFFMFGALTTSQSSSTLILVPIGLAAGIPPEYIIAMWLAVIGIYFFPANGSQIATIEFDRTGSTYIGKFVLNHSFMIPTLLSALFAVGYGFLFAFLFR